MKELLNNRRYFQNLGKIKIVIYAFSQIWREELKSGKGIEKNFLQPGAVDIQLDVNDH